MVDLDQYTRDFIKTPQEYKYSEKEKNYFWEQFGPRWQKVDVSNTTDLKALLIKWGWFTISEFGIDADHNAWLLAQHADHDREFQREILEILESLHKTKETNSTNYAYLFDRVAASWNNEKLRTLQRYGTQGMCEGPSNWVPIPMEEPENIDVRRKSVGLEILAENIDRASQYCY